MDNELQRLEEALRRTSDNLIRYLREVFGSEDDPRAVELLRLTSQKEVAEDALVTYLLDTMPIEEEPETLPPPAKIDPAKSGKFIH